MEKSGRYYSNVDRFNMGSLEEPLSEYMTVPNIKYSASLFSEEGEDFDVRDNSVIYSPRVMRPPSSQHGKDDRFKRDLEKRCREMRNVLKLQEKISITSVPDTEPLSWLESPSDDVEGISEMKESESKSELRNENRQLKKNLSRVVRMLDCERAQHNALKERMSELEARLDNVANFSKDFFPERYAKKIKDIQKKMLTYKAELETERENNKRLQQEIESVRKDSRKCQEKMRLLMFQHVPNETTKFKDIGPVVETVHQSKEKIANYKLGKILGEGHYGKVQIGTHIPTKKEYAIKVLHKDRISRFKDLQQVAMEVHVLKKYPHPNIVRLQEVIHAADKIYIITELCAMDLHKYHNDVGLSEDEAKQVIYGVLRPLHHLHSHGIVHLDLKPENILLRRIDLHNVTYEDIRLCDFGLVNMAKKPEVSKAVFRKGYACGTPGFFAPEMILKNEFEGRQADMWSLGCITLEVTLGFTQEWIESYEKTESNPDAFRSGLENCLEEISPSLYPNHRSLLNIIHSCLNMDPSKRISAAEALEHPWLTDVIPDFEARQDSLHSSVHGSPALYAERNAFVASAILCS